MAQTVAAVVNLGGAYTGLTIGYRVLNVDGTTYTAFTTTNVVETSVLGTYRVTGGVVVDDSGGYIVFGESGTDLAEVAVEPIRSSSSSSSGAGATWTYSGGSNVVLRSQSEILAQLETLLMDTSNDRWTDAHIYNALNLAIAQWQGRVLIPFAHEISGGWVAGTFEYELPSWMEGALTPQQKKYTDDSANSLTWTDILEFTVEPTATGGRVMRFSYQPYEDAGRVLWWGYNGTLPTTLPVTSGALDTDDTSITLSTKPTVGRSGYVKVDGEWMAYFGVTESASTITLTNVARGVNHTSAASHSVGATVTWGIAMDDVGLTAQLINQARVYLMQMWLSNPSSREVGHYERQMPYYQQQADMFWRRYTPKRDTKFRLTRTGLGPMNGGGAYAII